MKMKEYIIESEKVNKDKNIAVISDFHLSENTRKNKIMTVLNILYDISPSHIVIPGDLYNIYDPNEVIRFINELSKISEVFYVRGDSDLRDDNLTIDLSKCSSNFHFVCQNNKRKRPNTVFSKGINISGIELTEEFYQLSEALKREELLHKYNFYIKELSKNLSPDEFNVLLCHDPIIQKVIEYYEVSHRSHLRFDLVISGHNHGGKYSKIFKPILNFAGINLEKIYPTYTNGIIVNDNNKYHIISEGLTKFHSQSGVFSNLENFCEGTIENIKILKKTKKKH